MEAEVTVRKVSGRRVMFETICRRSSDQAVLVDGAALARMQAKSSADNHKLLSPKSII